MGSRGARNGGALPALPPAGPLSSPLPQTALLQTVLLQTVLDTVDVGIVACDAGGRLSLFNRAAREFHGMPPDPGLDPRHWAHRYRLYADDGRTPLAAGDVPLLRALQGEDVVATVISTVPEDGPTRFLRCDGRRLCGDDGALLGAVVVMADVTADRAAARALAEREELTRSLLDAVQTAIVACDAQGRSLFVNATGRATPPSASRLPLERALAGQDVQDAEVLVTSGRRRRSLRVHAQALRAADGTLLGAVSAAHDVTALVASEQRFRTAFEDAPSPIACLDGTGRITDANPALRRFLDLPVARLVGWPLADLAHAEDRATLAAALAGPGTGPTGPEVRLVRRDGRARWCAVATSRGTDADGASYVLVQLVDVHVRKVHELSLERAARQDPLTGLGNRTVLHQRLAALLDPTTGDGAVLLFVDLDGFKAVNDAAGHEAGDAVLVATADRLLAAVRGEDVVVRLGGDEFVVVCPLPPEEPEQREEPEQGEQPEPGQPEPGRSEAGATALARRLERALAEPVETGDLVVTVGASVGAAVARPGGDPQALLDRADRAMYERKARARRGTLLAASRPGVAGATTAPGVAGSDGSRRGTPGTGAPRAAAAGAPPGGALPAGARSGDAPSGEAPLDELVATALDEGRVRLAYQPVVDLRSGEVLGAEALLRIADRSGRALRPDLVVGVAEAEGHIGRLGVWVAREALAQAARWKRGLPPGAAFAIGVNISPLQVALPSFVAEVADAVAASGIDPTAVVLEVTESRPLPDTDAVQRALRGVRDLGVHLAVDDFGTGYAGIATLSTFPFDTVKIDRSWTRRLTGTGAAARVADGVFALAAASGFVTVVEGIETAAERDAALARGCTLAQGYLWSRPVDAASFARLLPGRVGATGCAGASRAAA